MILTLVLAILTYVLAIPRYPEQIALVQSARPKYTIDGNLMVTNWDPFKSFPTHLQQTLKAKYSLNLTDAFNNDHIFNKELQHPGYARVIIVSPQEFDELQKVGITMQEVDAIALNHYIQYTIMTAECFGMQEDENGDGVVFLRVKARTWDAMRKDIEDLYVERGGKDGFHKEDFWPHMTVSGTANGLEVDDWKVAREKGCFADVEVGDIWGLVM